MRMMGGLLASAYLRTVFLWMPNSLAIARMERPRSLACCTAFHRTLCRGVGFLRGDAGGLRTLPPPFNVALSASMASRDAKLSLGWLAHAVDPTVKAGAISERTIGGTENSRARRRLLCGDRASPGLHEELSFQALMDLQLRSGVARPLLTRQQLQGTPVVLDGVVPGHLAAVLEAEYLVQGHR